jgi:hypothetical protein
VSRVSPTLDRLSQLLSLAFAEGDAREANTLISAQRDALAGEVGSAWSYEVDLSGEGALERLLLVTYPRLVEFLSCRGTRRGEGVFLSLFRGERLYFVYVPDALGLMEAWAAGQGEPQT